MIPITICCKQHGAPLNILPIKTWTRFDVLVCVIHIPVSCETGSHRSILLRVGAHGGPRGPQARDALAVSCRGLCGLTRCAVSLSIGHVDTQLSHNCPVVMRQHFFLSRLILKLCLSKSHYFRPTLTNEIDVQRARAHTDVR